MTCSRGPKGPGPGARGSSKFLSPAPPTPTEMYESGRARPLSGGPGDARRVRVVRGFWETIPDKNVLSFDRATTVFYAFAANRLETVIDTYVVPDGKTLFIDRVTFNARTINNPEYMAVGMIEGYIESYMKIEGGVPGAWSHDRAINGVPLGVNADRFAQFAELDDFEGQARHDPTVIARDGQRVQTTYITQWPPPVAVEYLTSRVRGFLVDSIIAGEFLEQQR